MSSKGTPSSMEAVSRPGELSMDHTILNDLPHAPISTPPPYSGPTSLTPQQPLPVVTVPGLPRLNYSLYHPPNSKLSADKTTLTTNKSELNMYPVVLNSLIQSQAKVPPKPQIHVRGITRSGRVDFDIKLNMMWLLVSECSGAGRGEGWNYLKVVDDGELAWRGKSKESTEPRIRGGIEEWTKKYCQDTSAVKQFTLERVVTNWDTSYLEDRLHLLMASLNYRGQVEVCFSITHSKVVVRSPDKVNWLFTNMAQLFTGTKKYAVVKAVWPYASVPPGVADRSFAVQSEEAWWNDWKDAIRAAVLSGRKGWVTIEDRLEFLMAPPKDTSREHVGEWGLDA